METTDGKYTSLRLLFVRQECTFGLGPEIPKHRLPERLLLRHRLCLHRNLHPTRCQYRRLRIVISIPAPFQRLPPIHGPRCQRNPPLILANNRDHPCLVDLRSLDLIPRVLHEPKIVGYLSLVHRLLQRLLREYLPRLLKVLVLVLVRVQYLLRYQLALLSLTGSYRTMGFLLSLGKEVCGVDEGGRGDVGGVGGLVPGGLDILLLSDHAIVLDAV